MEVENVALKVGLVEQMDAVPRLMLSIDQSCTALNLSKSEVYLLMQSGDLPFVQIGRRRLISMDDLKSFVRRHRVETQELQQRQRAEQQVLQHRRERYAETVPPRTKLSKGSVSQRARRKSNKDVPLAERYAAVERTEAPVKKRASVPTGTTTTTAAAD